MGHGFHPENCGFPADVPLNLNRLIVTFSYDSYVLYFLRLRLHLVLTKEVGETKLVSSS